MAGLFLFSFSPIKAEETASSTSSKYEKQYAQFPLDFKKYQDPDSTLWEKLKYRAVQQRGFNLATLIIFVCAILHTFNVAFFQRWERKQKAKESDRGEQTSTKTYLLRFLGEIEIVFILWTCVLMLASTIFFATNFSFSGILDGLHEFILYVSKDLEYNEPLFIVIIMAISASRPILLLVEKMIEKIVCLVGDSVKAWWVVILSITPLMGSLITEPAAMTIAALLLVKKFYRYSPNEMLSYGTIGLLFVNISVGGTLTHFAAPPVLVIANAWELGLKEMFVMFGIKSIAGIFLSTFAYFFLFRKQFDELEKKHLQETFEKEKEIPLWITFSHLFFLAWTVFVNHYPPLFIGGFFLFLGLLEATQHHQSKLNLKSPLLVGIFLAGLITLGKTQGWWLELVLTSIENNFIFFFGSLALTSINDNAAITYLASQVESLQGITRYYILSGAVIGGGLTVIANAPNPAGKNILEKFFPEGIHPLKLFLSALLPTLIMVLIFLLFPAS